MPPKKGKEGTKGWVQIKEENVSTISFYRNMIIASNSIFLACTLLFFDIFTFTNIILFVLSSAAFMGSYQFMQYMARTITNEQGQLIDCGVDLNMEGGIGEHVKDLIILTSICQALSLVSNYFWLLWLLAPCRGFHFLWKMVLQPYFFQSAPEQPEIDEKKQRKMERKMKRH